MEENESLLSVNVSLERTLEDYHSKLIRLSSSKQSLESTLTQVSAEKDEWQTSCQQLEQRADELNHQLLKVRSALETERMDREEKEAQLEQAEQLLEDATRELSS